MMEYPGEENTEAILETLLTYSVSFNMRSDGNALLDIDTSSLCGWLAILLHSAKQNLHIAGEERELSCNSNFTSAVFHLY